MADTVQSDDIDWRFRLSGIYGENYRDTTAFGIVSYRTGWPLRHPGRGA